MKRRNQSQPSADDFVNRLRQLILEFGSRYALAKASGIPASTLQSYEVGSRPGSAALIRLAQTGNVDLNWLLAGKGELRPAGLLSGALLADVLMVYQYQMGAARSMEMIVGQMPFSRSWLENQLRLKEPTHDSLLLVEADWKLHDISRGDLVLIDCRQSDLSRDGVYLLDLPGLVLRGITRGLGDKITIIGPTDRGSQSLARSGRAGSRALGGREEMLRGDLLCDGGFVASKVAGRAVWISRQI